MYIYSLPGFVLEFEFVVEGREVDVVPLPLLNYNGEKNNGIYINQIIYI